MVTETYNKFPEALTGHIEDQTPPHLEEDITGLTTLQPGLPIFVPSHNIQILDTSTFTDLIESSTQTPSTDNASCMEVATLPAEKLPFEKTIQFLVETLEEGAALTLEKLPQRTQAMLKRGFFILEEYFGKGRNGQEIADEMSITKSVVYQIKNRTIKELWNHSTPTIKERYPIASLRFERPHTVERDMNISRGKGGRATRIAELAQQGVRAAEICSQLDITTETLNKYRYILRRWGIDMPYTIEGHKVKKRIQDAIGQERLTDLTVKRLLTTVPLGLYEKNNKGDNPLFTPIKTVATKAGFRYSGNIAYKFYEELERAGIPIGRVTREVKSGNQKPQTYFFILSQHIERAVRALQAYPELDGYRIKN